jgi:hypothetical protein
MVFCPVYSTIIQEQYMSSQSNILLWAALSIALVLGIVFDVCPPPDELSRVRCIPSQGLGFESMDIALNKSELSLYNKAEVVKRYYRVGKNRFMLIAIDGIKNRHAVHDPLYCFRGAGWMIVKKDKLPVEGGEALLLHLKKSDNYQDVVYWFSDGRIRHGSVVRYWIQATLRRITMGRSGKEPILVMIQSIENEPIDFMQIFDQFGALFQV